MTDRKGVDSIGRGRGSDGKRGGAGCGGAAALLRERSRQSCGSWRIAERSRFRRPIPRAGHCGAELIRAGLHGGTGGERDHFIMAPR